MIAWRPVTDMGIEDAKKAGRVLTYSPAYGADNPMRFRLMDAQFMRMCTEITHFAYVEPPK